MYVCVTCCRCHTFGIGSEVCVELVTGIAALSCGKCVLLKEGERLQTKVRFNVLLSQCSIKMFTLILLPNICFHFVQFTILVWLRSWIGTLKFLCAETCLSNSHL